LSENKHTSWDALPDGLDLGESVRISVRSDLLPDGEYGEEWLVVTDSRALVVERDGEGARVRWESALTELSEPKAESFVGGGALEVTRNGTREEVIRYTNARASRFGTVARLIEKWAEGEEAEVPDEEEDRCPECGLPLEKGSKVCPLCTPKRRTLWRLLRYLWRYLGFAALLSMLALLNTALGLVPPYLQKPLMDQVLAPQDATLELAVRFRWLGLLVLGLALARVLMAAASAGQGWLSAWLGTRITHDIRCQLYGHLQFLSLNFFDKRQIGNVISRVNQDASQLERFLVWGAQDTITNLLLVVGIGVMLFAMNWQLALFVFLPTPLVVLVSVAFWRRIRYYIGRYFHRWSRLNAILSETLTGLKVVKAFAQERREIERFEEQSQEVADAGVAGERLWTVIFTLIGLIVMLGTLIVMYVGGRDVLNGEMTLGTLVAFLAYLAMFFAPIRSLSMLLNWASRSLTAAERVFEVLDSQPEVVESEDAVSIPSIEGRVEFRGVHFGYERHRPVLKDVSFDVPQGEMIGLVGHSGAGKSTTINLICRFYDINEGELLIDGVPIQRIRSADLRRQIGLVPQDTFLFRGTIAQNIGYAKPDATKAEILRAAKIANAHEFIIEKADGYETMIGEKGQGLSGGEKQRVAIARAVLHDPRILILDEATSHVDLDAEKEIQEAIQRLIRGRTTFAIAHRLSTLKHADRLVVLKSGEVCEIGSHDELLKKEGEFHRLVETYQEISKVREVER